MSSRHRFARSGYHLLERTPLAPVLDLDSIRSLKKWIKRREYFELTVKGAVIRVPAHLEAFYSKGFEDLSLDWVAENVTAGMTVVDVGAHVGIFSLVSSGLVGKEGRVHAFEPAEENLVYLEGNIARGGASNVSVTSAAVGAERCIRTFHLTGSSDEHGFYGNHHRETEKIVEVQQVSLDGVLDTADVVKIDVEGAEIEVIEGMERLLRDETPILIVEWSPLCQEKAGRGPDDLINVIEAHGYSIEVLDDLMGERRSVEDTRRRLAAGEFPREWYANLLCHPRMATA